MRKAWIVLLLTLAVCIPVLGEEPSASPLDGTWKATFADSLFSGTVYLMLEVQDDGAVSGTYRATTGGFGSVAGRLDGKTFSFTLTQTVEGCPGSYTGSMVLQGEQRTGTYVGNDCQGEHENGVVSMVRATVEEIASLESSEVLPAGNIYVQGRRYWVSKSNNYLVLVSAEQTGRYFVLHIGIQNESGNFVTFDPEQIVIEDLLESKRQLRYYSPDRVAKKIRRRGAWASFFRAFAAGMQAFGQSQPTTSYSRGTFSAYDQYGNFAYGTYSGRTTTYSPPDTSEIQRQSAQDIARIRQSTEASVSKVKGTAVYAHTIAPKSYILGYVHFSKAKKQKLNKLLGVNRKDFLVNMLVPVGDEVFRFAFPMKVLEEALRN